MPSGDGLGAARAPEILVRHADDAPGIDHEIRRIEDAARLETGGERVLGKLIVGGAADGSRPKAFDEFGIEEECTTKADYLLALNHFLIERLEQDLSTLLIVDEAQNLSPEMLEEIRLLSNLETPTSKLIQIMLVGQPELWEMLSRPELRQLRQRSG